MILSTVPLNELTEQMLGEAVSLGLYEGQDLDFKREAYGEADSAKRSLLRDVVSMTNGGGGLIVIGVGEEPDTDGKAGGINPVSDGEEESERILASCLSGIVDRIPGLDVRPIPVQGGHVIAIRCPRSFRGPHMVAFKDENRFWIRHQKTNQRMTVREIRDAFSQSVSYGHEVRELVDSHRKRLENRVGVYLLVTASPYGLLEDVLDVNDHRVRELLESPPMVDGYLGGLEQVRPTLDGLFAKGSWGNYNDWRLQLGRSAFLSLVARIPAYNPEYAVYPTIRSLCKYPVSLGMLARDLYRHLGVTGPFVLTLDVFVQIDSTGFERLHPSFQDAFKNLHPDSHFVNTRAILPERIATSLERPDREFRPLLDILWNGFGRDKCPYFDDEGNLTTGAAGAS